MPEAYMTIDDSPTRQTDELTDYLERKNVPAVLFCIGSAYEDIIPCEGMEQIPEPIVRAIGKGFIVGNHTYTHRRSSEMSYEEIVGEIEKTEAIIDRLYRQAGRARTHKLLRFPQIDRGCGNANVVDFSKVGPYADIIRDIFLKGLNIKNVPVTQENIEKKEKVQAYLKREGFVADVFNNVTFPWYTGTEMADAQDCLYTFSTSDWMMNPDFRALGYAWEYQSIDALKERIDHDPWLHSPDSRNIVLAHDHNNMLGVTTALIDHMLARGITFQPV